MTQVMQNTVHEPYLLEDLADPDKHEFQKY